MVEKGVTAHKTRGAVLELSPPVHIRLKKRAHCSYLFLKVYKVPYIIIVAVQTSLLLFLFLLILLLFLVLFWNDIVEEAEVVLREEVIHTFSDSHKGQDLQVRTDATASAVRMSADLGPEHSRAPRPRR